MRFLIGILLLLAGVAHYPAPVLAQTGLPSRYEMLASLRSGNPQRVTHALESITQNALARSLYADLYRLAGSEPSSRIEASAVAKALGFVLIVGLDEQLLPLSPGEFSEKMTRLESLLAGIDPTVSGVAEEFQWRAVELMQFATAYDFLRAAKGSPVPPAENAIALFADNAAQQLCGSFVVRNNLSIKLAAAAGYAALMLQGGHYDEAKNTPEQWLEASYLHIEKTLFEYQGNGSGYYGYSEGPWYFRYAMQNLIPFLLAIDASSDGGTMVIGGKDVRSPLRDPKYLRLFEWIGALRMPDGMLPPFEDTYMQAWFPEAAAVAAQQPEAGFLSWQNYDGGGRPMEPSRLSAELSRNFDTRVEYLLTEAMATGGEMQLPLTQIMPDAGYAVFRSGWTPDALYFALIGKHGIARTHRSPVGSGHKHANETAFILHAGGELLAIEPGYHSSGEREELIFGDNHNILLIDGKGPDSTSWGTFLFGVDAEIGDTLGSGNAGMVSIRTNYAGADIERRAVMLGGQYVILSDRVASGTEREFTHQLHGNGLESAATCTADPVRQGAVWTRNAMKLHAVVSTPDGAPAQRLVTRRHAPAGQRFADHSALYSTIRGSEAVFHTVLCAAPAGEAVTTRVLRQDGRISVLTVRHADHELISINNASGATASAELPALGRTSTDALAMHCILNSAGRPDTWMLDEGSFILSDDRMMLSSSHILRALAVFDEREIRLSVRGDEAATLQLRVPATVSAVFGEGVARWQLTGNMLLLQLSAADADIRIELTSTLTEAEDAALLPTAAVLHAVYPQPARSGADVTCSFTLPFAEQTGVVVHDALGRRVSDQETVMREAGTHTVRLSTAGLRPGVYFIRLLSAGATVTRQLLIR